MSLMAHCRNSTSKNQRPIFHYLERLFWAVALLLVGVMILTDFSFRLDIIRKVSAVTLTDVAPGTQPLPAGSHEEMLILPGGSMDARWWVLHTRQLLESHDWRVRETARDNAPEGREVHWSSLIFWFLALGANFLAAWHGGVASAWVAEAGLWFGPLTMCIFTAGLGSLVWRGFSSLAALFFLGVLVTAVPVYQMSVLGEVDHHGLVLAFALASLLALLAGGVGLSQKDSISACWPDFPKPSTARNWFRVSGILGGAALWVSAATALPILLGIGAGGALLILLAPKIAPKAKLRPELWLDWGWAGALASLAFYLLEYFPGRMGWRLEVNHPLYALAWLGGAYWLQALGRWRQGERKSFRTPRGVMNLILATATLILPPLVIALAPHKVFWVADRFLLDLHREFITEFLSLPRFFQTYGADSRYIYIMYFTWPLLLSLWLMSWLAGQRPSPRALAGMVFLGPVLLGMTALGFYQIRWFPIALGIWAVVGLVLFQEAQTGTGRWATAGKVFARLALLAAIIFALGPQVVIRHLQYETCTNAPIAEEFGNGIILRDIAHRLIQSSPNRLPVVLTGPNSSTHLTYHGGLKTLGTLYWENMPGLKRAAEIFSAPDETTALQLLREAGVTHLVLPSWDNFAQAYTALLATAQGREDNEAPFFQAIVNGSLTPQWLRPFCYPIPSGSALDTNSVKIFAFLPEQNAFEAAFFRGIYHYEAGEPERAVEQFRTAQLLRPQDPRPKAYLAELESQLRSPSAP